LIPPGPQAGDVVVGGGDEDLTDRGFDAL